MDDQPLLVDFLSMTMVNLRTRKQRSVAWLDGAGKWFYPSALFDEEANEYRKLDMSIFEDNAGGMTGAKVAKSPSEAVKKVVVETSHPPHIPCTIDILRKRVVPVERGSGSFVFVQNLFLSGMGLFAMPNSILRIHRYLPKDITAQNRLEAFERQMRLTREKRGTANARYGWLGCKKQDVVGILTNGFVSIGKTTGHADIYLSPENRAFTSVSLCDVDEKGIQYMLLCRAILGNMGTIKPGSEEEFPSTEIHDSGVDNCSNPSYYLIWNSHLSTHICLEYLISFKLAPEVQDYLGQKGLWFHPPPKEGIGDLSTLQPIMCKSDEGPISPWISFKVLFETIQGSISPIARELLFLHYEELRENKITRKEMVKNMVIIVGEKLLVDSLKKLHCSPSLWFKPSAKVATDSTNATVGSMCIDTRGNAPSAALAHESLAPNAVLERCELIDSTCGGSPQVSVAFIRQDSSIASMSSQNSLEHCTDGRDPFMPIVVPTVQTSVLREVPENFAFLKTNNCNSFGLRMDSNSNSQNSYSVRHNSLVPIPQFGNSESVSRKGLGSVAPSMPLKVLESLPTSTARENSSYRDAKGSGTAIPCVSPQLHQSSSMLRQFSARSMEPHVHVANMAPHLRAPSKMSQVHVQSEMLQPFKNSVMLQAQHSGAKTVISVSSILTLPSGTSKGHATATSSNELKENEPAGSNTRVKDINCAAPNVALKGPDGSANSATKGLKASNRKSVMSSNSAAQCGAKKKMPIKSVDASRTVIVTLAADALIALSAPDEKDR